MAPEPAAAAAKAADATVGLDAILSELSSEMARLAEQCGVIQGSISTMLDAVNHPDLGAEIHILQDIDRIQQTLADVAAILSVARSHAAGATLAKEEVGAVIRLESLQQRLGLSDGQSGEARPAAASDVTWL